MLCLTIFFISVEFLKENTRTVEMHLLFFLKITISCFNFCFYMTLTENEQLTKSLPMLQECGKNMKIFSLLITQKFRNLSEYTYLYKIKV